MKTDKKPVIGFICVMLSCILVMGITIGLLSSANNKIAAGTTADTTADNTTKNPEVPPIDEPELEPELEWGFGVGSGCDSLSGCIAYKSDKDTFDVDDVTLTIYYGDTWYDCDIHRKQAEDVPVFEIACENFISGDQYLIREVNENLVSDEYKIVKIYDEKHETVQKVIYNHSEEITIPKEVFQGDWGIITLYIGGFNVSGDTEPTYKIFAYAYISYEMVSPSKVWLSPAYDIVREFY